MARLKVIDQPFPEPGSRVTSAPIIISMVSRADDTETRDIGIDKVLEAIRTGGNKLKGQITQIRNRFKAELAITGDREKAKRAVKALKKQLHGVTPSGRFRERKAEALIEYVGLLCIDIDLLGERLPEIRKKVEASPYVAAVFLSPTGDGLKVWVRVPADPAKHLASFRAVEKHVRELTGVEIDENCKDVSRLCFMSYDPELYVNENATPITPLPEPEHPKRDRSLDRSSKPGKQTIRDMLSVIPKRPHYKDWMDIVSAVGDALPDNEAIEVLQEWSPEEQPGEYAYKLQHRLTEIHVGTLIHLAKQHGWRPVDLWKGNVTITSEPERDELPPAPTPYEPPPLDLLPPELQNFVRTGAKATDVDTAFLFLPLLSEIAACIGISRSIRIKEGWIQPPIVWTSVVAESGEGKDPAMQAAIKPQLLHEFTFKRENDENIKEYKKSRAKWKATKKSERGERPEPPPLKTCLMDDATIEAVACRANDNPSGILLAKAELSHWFGSFDQYRDRSGADLARWLQLYDGILFAIDRVTGNRNYRIPNPRISIAAGVQPDTLRRILTDEYFERGLPARFRWAMPKRTKPRRFSKITIPPNLFAKVSRLLSRLRELKPYEDEESEVLMPVLLSLSPEAERIFEDFYNEVGRIIDQSAPRMRAQWSKLIGGSAALALVGQLAHDPDAEEISGQIIEHACALARWFGKEAARIYAALAETRDQRNQRELIEFVERRGGAVYEREVMQSFTRLKNDKDGTASELDALVKAGRGEWEPVEHGGGPGRPTRKFRLLRSSTSTQFDISRGKTENSVDVDTSSGQKITPLVEQNAEPVSDDEREAMPTGLSEL